MNLQKKAPYFLIVKLPYDLIVLAKNPLNDEFLGRSLLKKFKYKGIFANKNNTGSFLSILNNIREFLLLKKYKDFFSNLR